MAIAAVGMTATSALSMPMTIPAALNPGDQYRLTFVTSSQRDALSTDIAVYNDFVTGVANSAGLGSLGTMWYAIVSTDDVDARDNTGTNPGTDGTGFPIFLLDAGSTKIADNNADLWDGSIDNLLNVDETGAIPNPEDIWTGSFANGTQANNDPVGGGTDMISIIGRVEYSDQDWISRARGAANLNHPFYALSGILTVPSAVPEPGVLSLAVLGIVGLAVSRRRWTGSSPKMTK